MTDTPGRSGPAWSHRSVSMVLPSAFALRGITPEWAWGGATGAGARVAIVDSGVDASHPWLGDCVDQVGGASARLAGDGSVVLVPGAHSDAFGHGTACAGVVHQLAPRATVISVQVLGPGLTGRATVFLEGLRWAIEQGVDVINLSLGTTKDTYTAAFHELCDLAYFRGITIVTAANNVDRVSYPSLFASVTSVACNHATDPFRYHYNPNPPTEFLARGIDVEVAWRAGHTMRATGNSYAAPHISGLIALIKSKHPKLRPFQLKTILHACAANVLEAPRQAGRISRLRNTRPSTCSSRPTGAPGAPTP